MKIRRPVRQTLLTALLLAAASALCCCQPDIKTKSVANSISSSSTSSVLYLDEDVMVTLVDEFGDMDWPSGTEFPTEIKSEYLSIEGRAWILRIETLNGSLRAVGLYEGTVEDVLDEHGFWEYPATYIHACTERLSVKSLPSSMRVKAEAAKELCSLALNRMGASKASLAAVFSDVITRVADSKFSLREDCAPMMSVRSGEILSGRDRWSYYEFGAYAEAPGMVELALCGDRFVLSHHSDLHIPCALLWDGSRLLTLVGGLKYEQDEQLSARRCRKEANAALKDIEQAVELFIGLLDAHAYELVKAEDTMSVSEMLNIIGRHAKNSDVTYEEWLRLQELISVNDADYVPFQFPEAVSVEKPVVVESKGVEVRYSLGKSPGVQVKLTGSVLPEIVLSPSSTGVVTGRLRGRDKDSRSVDIASSSWRLASSYDQKAEDTIAFNQETIKRLQRELLSTLPQWVSELLSVVADRMFSVEMPIPYFHLSAEYKVAQGKDTGYLAFVLSEITDRLRVSLLAIDDETRVTFRSVEDQVYFVIEATDGQVLAVRVGPEAEEVTPEMVVDAATAYASMIEQGVLQPLPEYRKQIAQVLSFLVEGRDYDRVVSVKANEFVEDGYRTKYPGKEG